MITAIPIIAITAANGIQSGDVTHHHDQYCTGPTSASFKVRNIRKSTVPIPIPLDVDLLLLM